MRRETVTHTNTRQGQHHTTIRSGSRISRCVCEYICMYVPVTITPEPASNKLDCDNIAIRSAVRISRCISYLCRVLFARATVLGLCFFVSVNIYIYVCTFVSPPPPSRPRRLACNTGIQVSRVHSGFVGFSDSRRIREMVHPNFK